MTNEKPLEFEPEDSVSETAEDSVSEAASDWFRTFCKHLNANFIPAASELPFEADIPDYQAATLTAVLETLLDSGMMTDSVRKEVDRFLTDSGQSKKTGRQFGLSKGKLAIVSDDDEHLEHFGNYIP